MSESAGARRESKVRRVCEEGDVAESGVNFFQPRLSPTQESSICVLSEWDKHEGLGGERP